MANEKSFSSEDVRWQALVQRDPQADGAFFYGVKTTGIYCRPVCPSRLPNRENTQFFDTWQQAEEAGFRPCKRCTPHQSEAPNTAADAIARACDIIAEAEKEPSLNELAEAVGLSPHHFHRLFKKATGVTPKQYMMEKRAARLRENLQGPGSVTDAIYDAGYESSSRFYEKAESSLGMKPLEYKKGGEGVTISYAVVQSYLGWVLVAVTERGICQIDFADTPEVLETRLEERFSKADLRRDDPRITAIVSQTVAFLEAPAPDFSLPLDVQGTAFQKRVWAALQEIQPGKTVSYSDIAQRIGNPKAARAVARACASNKIAVAIPCHRVLRSNGELGGYRWGLARKRRILEREAERIVS
jgi:AraC family transcriptional regulator, regulatory protein of adaptative response / methylated-DNA-[protein]-cysteine methyltransferase